MPIKNKIIIYLLFEFRCSFDSCTETHTRARASTHIHSHGDRMNVWMRFSSPKSETHTSIHSSFMKWEKTMRVEIERVASTDQRKRLERFENTQFPFIFPICGDNPCMKSWTRNHYARFAPSTVLKVIKFASLLHTLLACSCHLLLHHSRSGELR